MMDKDAEIKLLQDNMKEMQTQLGNANKRISELIKEKAITYDELYKEREYASDLKKRLRELDKETTEKIQERMDSIPDVLDSKPMTFKKPPQPSYTVKEGEKWVTIKDGKMEFEDIEIKE
tara:strand:- start:316 stop:675 length:360 start_codon:yes stop_codon:yes gene_type:complete